MQNGNLAPAIKSFQAIFMAMDEGAILLDKSGQVVAANPAAENILGLAATELIGRSSAECARALNFIREDGTPFPGELNPVTLALQTGRPQHHVLVCAHRPGGDSGLVIRERATDGLGWRIRAVCGRHRHFATSPSARLAKTV